VLLAGGEPLARQGLFVSLLHLNVAPLQLERPGQSTAGSHAGKVFGGVDREDITEDFGQDGRKSADMQIDRVDAHEHKAKSVFAMGTTRQIWKAEETALHVKFVLGDRGRSDQLAHESPRCSSIRLYEGSLLAGPFCIPKGTVDHVERVAKLLRLGSPRLRVGDQELYDGGRVDHPSIALPKAACARCYGLLPYPELVVEVAVVLSAGCSSLEANGAYSCSLYTGCGMEPGSGMARDGGF